MTDRISPLRWRLYVITDEQVSRGRSHFQIAEAAILGGADVLQLRDKESSSGRLSRWRWQLRKLTREAKVPLIVNDRLDIALLRMPTGCMSARPICRIRGARHHGPRQDPGGFGGNGGGSMAAEKDGADYLGVGPVFEARRTKPDAGEPGALNSSS